MSILDRKLLRNLWQIRGQAAMITLVIACGIATAVMSFSVLRSLAETRDEYYARYRFADVFATLSRGPESVAEAIGRIAGIARMETRLAVDVALEVEDMDEPALGRLLSLPDGEPGVNAIALRRGRTIAPGRADEIIVSENFADAHGLIAGAQLHAMLGGNKRQFTIVGIALSPEYIYALGPGQIAPDDRRFGVLWMGREALAAALDYQGQFNEVNVRLDGSRPRQDVIEHLAAVLKPYGGFAIYGRERQSSNAFLSTMFEQLAGVGRSVPAIFIAVAAFLAHTILGRLIETQRQDIGLLKALGISDRTIRWHYLKLVLVLTAIGIALGLAAGAGLGYGLTKIYAQFFHFPLLHYAQDPASAVAASTVSATAMVAGTLRAVHRAASLPPAVAMASVMPSDRITAWATPRVFRHLREPTRMIVRHLARWPLRAALAIVGVSLAVGLQISMLFSFDALDYMINEFYARAQRQDLTVFFAAALPRAVIDQASSWPGIKKVEGYRSVPARLGFGVRQRLVNLTGLPATSTLNRLLDVELTPLPVPLDGLAVSNKLAKLLGARIGDRLTIQTINPDTRSDAPIILITEQYIGLDAYMELTALNRLLREGPKISGVHLQIDRSRQKELYRVLKEAPAVAGISDRAVVLASFQQTMKRTLTIIVSFFVGFAGLTAFGIVYSNARIILAEREREMATLSAMGFSTTEVRYILTGELAILVILAIPIGCVFGRALSWLIAQRLDTELYRVPLIINASTFGVAISVVVGAALVSTWIVSREVGRLNVLAILNARQ